MSRNYVSRAKDGDAKTDPWNDESMYNVNGCLYAYAKNGHTGIDEILPLGEWGKTAKRYPVPELVGMGYTVSAPSMRR